MKAVSLNDIKQELQGLNAKEISELCLRLARYKKENKELLAYLLFNAHDIEAYTLEIKELMNELFNEVNKFRLFFAKKTLRKILRLVDKQVKFIQNKQTEAELRIYFCELLKSSGIAFYTNKTISNMYYQQIKKIKTALESLHEDIQHDFMKQVEQL